MEATKKVTVNATTGRQANYDAVVALMDDQIREELHTAEDWAAKPEPEQAFFDAYCAEHQKVFGAPFVL